MILRFSKKDFFDLKLGIENLSKIMVNHHDQPFASLRMVLLKVSVGEVELLHTFKVVKMMTLPKEVLRLLLRLMRPFY